MNTNVLSAIARIVETPIGELSALYVGRNRVNSVGAALEKYIKDVFAGTLNEVDEQKRLRKYNEVFSYGGNQNNPPDFMIKYGDAVEVKKLESKGAELALNSSYPKSVLFANDAMITKKCRTCEEWVKRDILYVAGVVQKEHLSKLFFVYGVDYAASASVYERIKKNIKDGILEIPNIEFAETKELGRINRVDPLGITYLRIRGMWGIDNPEKVFEYVYEPPGRQFEFAAVINKEKYNQFPLEDRERLEGLTNTEFLISDVEIKTPDNPIELKQAKLITFCR